MKWNLVLFGVLAASICVTFLPAAAADADQQLLYQQHLDPYPTKILVPVQISGKTYPFALCTLTYHTTLDTSLRDLVHGQADAGKGGEELFHSPQLLVGTWSIPPQTVELVDLTGINSLGPLNLRGSLGASLFSDRTLSLDFDHESLEIRDTPPRIPLNMEHADLGHKDYGFIAVVEQKLDDETIAFGVETASDGCIGIADELFSKLVAAGMIRRTGNRGLGESASSHQTDVQWGVFTRGQILGVDLAGKPAFGNGKVNMLGMDFLVNFNWIFDFKAGKVYYHWRDAEPPLSTRAMLGALVGRRDGSPVFIGVESGGTADAAGIKEGDRILRLGSLSQADIDQRSVYELCLHKNRATVEVELSRAGTDGPIKTELKLPEKCFQFLNEQ